MGAAAEILEIPEIRARVSRLSVAERRQEIYRQPENGSYLERESIEGEATLTCAGVPGIGVPFAGLF